MCSKTSLTGDTLNEQIKLNNSELLEDSFSPAISELPIVKKSPVSILLNDCHPPRMFEECNPFFKDSPSSELLEDSLSFGKSGLPFGSNINPNILNCKLCGKICKRAIFVPCCVSQACNGCAVIEITKKRMCWGCKNPVNSSKELIQDKVLREAIEWFRENGTIKMGHGESLLVRRQLQIKHQKTLSTNKEKPRDAQQDLPEDSTEAFEHEKKIIKHDASQSIETNERKRSRSPEYMQSKPVLRRRISRTRNKNKNVHCGKRQNKRIRNRNKRRRSRSVSGSHERNENISGSRKTYRSARFNALKRRQHGISGNISSEGDTSHRSNSTRNTCQNTKPIAYKKSTDPEELTDINCSNWEKIKRLKTDKERLWLAKSEFQNPICVDPTTNLTHHSYKRRKVFMLQNKDINSVYDFYATPEIVRLKQVKSEKRQMFYLNEGDTVAMPGFTKVLKLEKIEDLAPVAEVVKETISTKEFRILLEKKFYYHKNPLTKKSSKATDNFMSQLSHFKAGYSEAIKFLHFYRSEMEKSHVEEIVYLENLYKTFTACYGKVKPIFCKTCNIRHIF